MNAINFTILSVSEVIDSYSVKSNKVPAFSDPSLCLQNWIRTWDPSTYFSALYH